MHPSFYVSMYLWIYVYIYRCVYVIYSQIHRSRISTKTRESLLVDIYIYYKYISTNRVHVLVVKILLAQPASPIDASSLFCSMKNRKAKMECYNHLIDAF